MSTEQTPLIRYTGLMPLDGSGVVPLVWSKEQPTACDWYWWRKSSSDDRCVVQVIRFFNDESLTAMFVTGYRKTIDKITGEWAGPIPLPQPQPTTTAQHFYRVEEVEALLNEICAELANIVDVVIHKDQMEFLAQRLLDRLRGGA